MIKQALGVSTLSFAIAIAPLWGSISTARADTFCGTSSGGASVFAGNSETSCNFAINTAEAYRANGIGSQPFSVYSPVTGLTYTMTCTVAGSVCQGGNNALVFLR